MVEIFRHKRLNVPVAPLAAAGVAGVTALIFALIPGDLLGDLVLDSGIAALVPAAEPPLGFTARAVLVLFGGGGAGLLAWFAAYLLIGTRAITLFGAPDTAGTVAKDGDVPVLRRADAHPDAPARRPLFANSDLGTPFLEVRAPIHVVAGEDVVVVVESQPVPAPLVPVPVAKPAPLPPVEADLPADLDQPLAAFDPHAIPDEPLDWFTPPAPKPVAVTPVAAPAPVAIAPVAERPQLFTSNERFEAFELQPARAEAPRLRADFNASASIHDLLDRLEKSVGRREMPEPVTPAPVVAAPAVAAPVVTPITPITPPAPRQDSLQEALMTLRKLAAAR